MPMIGVAASASRAGFLARFAEDKRGSTAIMFGLMIMPVMFLTGMAVDYSRMITVKTRMQTAVDAAALAGVRAQQMSGATATTMGTVASTYYNTITKSLPYVVQTTLSAPSSSSSANQYTWTAQTWIATPFLSIAQMLDKSPSVAGAPAACQGSKWKCQMVASTASVLASMGGSNSGYDIETSFMLDITGSMSGQPLTDLKTAAGAAIDILVWNDQSKQTSRVAITPFAQDVRLPDGGAFQKATGTNANTASKKIYGYTFGTSGSEFCVGERQGPDKYKDTAPSTGNAPVVEWMYSGYGIQCNVPSNAAAQPLTADKTKLHNLINGLQTAGSTAGHIGMQWAWYMLSPNWANLWPDVNQPGAYDTAYNPNTKVGDPTKMKLKKIAVLMTDGDFNTEYTSQGILTSYFGESPANDTSSKQAAQVCANMKSAGIEVFTVAFSHDGGLSSAALTLLSNCATDTSHFYNAGNGAALTNAFKDIALKISKITIAG
jgi:Flp pilus assembly protein TadG